MARLEPFIFSLDEFRKNRNEINERVEIYLNAHKISGKKRQAFYDRLKIATEKAKISDDHVYFRIFANRVDYSFHNNSKLEDGAPIWK